MRLTLLFLRKIGIIFSSPVHKPAGILINLINKVRCNVLKALEAHDARAALAAMRTHIANTLEFRM